MASAAARTPRHTKCPDSPGPSRGRSHRSEEHTSELQSQSNLVCRLLLEKKKLAVHGSRFGVVLKQTGDLAGNVIVTCSLPLNDDNSGLVVGRASSSAHERANRFPKARHV